MSAYERIAQCPAIDPPSAAQEHREFAPPVQGPQDAPRAAEPVPASQRPQAEVLAGPRRALPPKTGRAPAGEEGASVAVARRARACAPPLPPLPSSVSVELSGACT